MDILKFHLEIIFIFFLKTHIYTIHFVVYSIYDVFPHYCEMLYGLFGLRMREGGRGRKEGRTE